MDDWEEGGAPELVAQLRTGLGQPWPPPRPLPQPSATVQCDAQDRHTCLRGFPPVSAPWWASQAEHAAVGGQQLERTARRSPTCARETGQGW